MRLYRKNPGLVFMPVCLPNACKVVLNVTIFQSNCAEGLHLSAFHFSIALISYYIGNNECHSIIS